MKKTILIFAAVLSLSLTATAHDEGHGPKVTDTGKFGGLISGVVLKKDASLGAKASLVHKAELTRSGEGVARLYLYDSKMNPLDMKSLSGTASATMWFRVKGKAMSSKFEMAAKDGAFEGKMPKPGAKPYNLDIELKQGDKELLTAFDNLD